MSDPPGILCWESLRSPLPMMRQYQGLEIPSYLNQKNGEDAKTKIFFQNLGNRKLSQ